TRALQASLAAIERRSGGRLGVHILHTGSGRHWGWRSDERFPMCSSFKLLLVAMALSAQAQGQLGLDERLRYGAGELVANSPITEAHVAQGGMTVAELCAATLATSDNTAANVLLARLGGPAAFTQHLRGLGDEVTRLDRYEPQLNGPGTQPDWDTSSPAAMARSLHRLVLGDGLPAAQQQQLIGWLQASVTGGRRLQAGLPSGWRIAEKTGTSNGSTNDMGVVWPASGAPLVVVGFIRNSRAPFAVREACLADVGRLLATLPVQAS
ncbi:MAG: class A beta-lactamase, partial [Burkholderiales bacterium PBB5]